MNTRELFQVLNQHEDWLEDPCNGELAKLKGADLSDTNLNDVDLSYADLRYANLKDVDLSGANLSYASLEGANLSRADLRGANLSETQLEGADLRGANLVRANLGYAFLRGANLRGANLANANLIHSSLAGANLENVILGPRSLGTLDKERLFPRNRKVPCIPNIHQNLHKAVSRPGALCLGMSHSACGTKHDLAGWIVTLAGGLGRELEVTTGCADIAAYQIYYKSDRLGLLGSVDFYTEDIEKVLQKLQRLAELEREKVEQQEDI